ncbi:MAG: BTAD domain-containing putative transcriptional regulator [Chloroflexota bacterium]
MTDAKPTTLYLTLLGTLQIRMGETPLLLRRAKEQALLIYLAVTRQIHSRSVLVDLLWSEMPEANARRNLTATLTNLRKELAEFLIVDLTSVSINPDAPVSVDILDCYRLLADGRAEDDLSKLRQAVDHYQGEFLAGFAVKDAFVFEEWAYTERERIRGQVMDGLELLVADAIRWENWANGVDYANRLLSIEPWRESAHRQLMTLYARAGQRHAAIEQFGRCKAILAEELAVEPSPETVALVEQLQATSVAPPHNLPSQPNAFIGRVEELAQIHAHISDESCRLLTISGPGGIGKTRLAMEAARRYTEPEEALTTGFVDGVYFVSLAPIQADEGPLAAGVTMAIAETLDVSLSGQTDLQGQLNQFLQTKSILLVCDNVEHLLVEKDTFSVLDSFQSILRNAPNVKLLTTSRQRLNIQEEWVLTIDGLAYPARDADNTFARRDAYPAVELLLRRAGQMQIGFTLSDTEIPDVVKLCQLLEGMPLGLELVAHWLRDLSPAEIVDELYFGLDILTTSMRGVSSRHRSMKAVFDYSWRLLTVDEQSTLCKLSIFRGGFTRKAAEDVAEATIRTLVALTDQSLLRRIEGRRYDLHELLRQFLAEKLAETGEIDKVRQAHGRYYFSVLVENEAGLFGEKPQQSIHLLRSELDNIRQAWHWLSSDGQWHLLVQGVSGLAKFYEVAGLAREGELLFEQAFTSLCSTSRGVPIPSLSPIYCRLRIEQARMLFAQSLLEQAIRGAQDALHYLESMPSIELDTSTLEADSRETFWVKGNNSNKPLMKTRLSREELEAQARFELGRSLHKSGEPVNAQDAYERALILARSVDDQHLEADILRYWCWNRYDQGDFAQAIELQSEAERLFRQLNDRLGVGITQFDNAFIALYMGDIPTASIRFAAALADFRQVGDRRFECFSVFNLALCYRGERKYTQCLAMMHEVLTLARTIHDLNAETHGHIVIGYILTQLGLYGEATHNLQQASVLNQSLGSRLNLARWHGDCAYLAYHQKRHTEALARMNEALPLIREMERYELEVEMLPTLGHIHYALNDHAAARRAYEQAIVMLKQTDDYRRMVEPLAGIAQLDLEVGEATSALAHVNTILQTIDEVGYTGVSEIFLVYLISYRVLSVASDPRTEEVLQTGQQLLSETAALIEDESTRRAFLNDVSINHELARIVHHVCLSEPSR